MWRTHCGTVVCLRMLLVGPSMRITSFWACIFWRQFTAFSGICVLPVESTCTTARLQSQRAVVLPGGNKDRVDSGSENNHPRCRRKVDSRLEPRAHSRTRTLESTSCGNSFWSSWKIGLSSGIKATEGFNRSPIVLCWQPICLSAGNWALCPLVVRKEKRIPTVTFRHSQAQFVFRPTIAQ